MNVPLLAHAHGILYPIDIIYIRNSVHEKLLTEFRNVAPYRTHNKIPFNLGVMALMDPLNMRFDHYNFNPNLSSQIRHVSLSGEISYNPGTSNIQIELDYMKDRQYNKLTRKNKNGILNKMRDFLYQRF